MSDNQDWVSAQAQAEDKKNEEELRPKDFNSFVGQNQIIENLNIAVKAALKRGDVLDHVLFCGPPGLGKTTLARIIANEMQAKIHVANGPALMKPADLAGILMQLEQGDVFFLDEIHRIPPTLEEYLYSAMEDYAIDIVLDQGSMNNRTVRIDLPKFTLIGATTKEGAMQAPFRDRFGIVERLKFYDEKNLKRILLRSSEILELEIDDLAACTLAKRTRGTPRVANRFLRRVRDLATLESSNNINEAMVKKALHMLDIDELGLQYIDRRILDILYQNQGRPVGLNTIAVSIGEDKNTIEDVYEPFLIQQNLIQKTTNGRILSDKGYRRFSTLEGRQDNASIFP